MQREPVLTEKDSDEGQQLSKEQKDNISRHHQNHSNERYLNRNQGMDRNPSSNPTMSIKISGCIRSGFFKEFQSLSVFYMISANSKNWKQISGQKSGFSQISSSPEDRIVWNFPFEIEYALNSFHQAPQMTVILYGYDFFGRSVAKAYGNIHMPLNSGTVRRKIRTFKMNQNSLWNRFLAFCSGSQYEFRQVEKVLKDDNQRASLRVSTSGQIDVEFITSRQQFEKYGYE